MIFLCYSTLDCKDDKPVASNRRLKQILLGRSLGVRSRWSRAANRSRSTSALRLFSLRPPVVTHDVSHVTEPGGSHFDTAWTHPHVDGRRIMRPVPSQRHQWASTPTDLTRPTQPFSSCHVLFNATTKSGKCQRLPPLPRLHAALCDFVLLTFYHQMPSLSPCQSSWLYDPLREGKKVLRWQLWSFAQPSALRRLRGASPSLPLSSFVT